jgi:hypothetical protein
MNAIQTFAKKIIVDTLTHQLMGSMDSHAARVLLAAIGFQESRFEYRTQLGGPAHGFWQFERGGGVTGVLTNVHTRNKAKGICFVRDVCAMPEPVYQAIVNDDFLACAFARLLLYADPRPLPLPGQSREAWDYYLHNWRPGKPKVASWPAMYARAMEMFP